MAKGITIRVTRLIERRHRRPDEIGVRIWNGTYWRSPSSLPFSPGLEWIYGCEPEKHTTVIEFPPPGTVPIHKNELYEKTLLPKIKAMGCHG